MNVDEKVRAFSLYAPQLQADPVPAFEELREAGPVLWSEQHDGFWFLTRHEDIEWVARNPELFSSQAPTLPYKSILGGEPQIPLSLDGDVHRKWRQAIADTFSPGTINHFTPAIRSAATELVAKLADGNRCDFVREFAVALPAEAFLIDFGIGRERLDEMLAFKEWLIREALPHAETDEELTQAAAPIRDFFAAAVEERRANPIADAKDVISHLLRATYDGRPLTMQEMTNALLVSMLASLDTTTSALGLAWAWLADHPEQRRWMIEHPDARPRVIEELLRSQPVLTTARVATQDVELHGVTIRAGERVLLSWGMAGIDPAAFPDPHRVDPDRSPGRNLAFGVGPHRCLGMHLARRIIAIAVDEWHASIPDYRLDPDTPPVRHYSSVRGLSSLPLIFG